MDDNANGVTPFVTTLAHAAADPFRLLVEAVKDYAIFMLDPEGHVSSWNPGAEKSKGYNAEEIMGQHVSCFYTAADRAAGKPEQGLRIALEEGRFEEEGLRLRKSGETFWAIVTITNIEDPLGHHVGYANVTRGHHRAEGGRGHAAIAGPGHRIVHAGAVHHGPGTARQPHHLRQ